MYLLSVDTALIGIVLLAHAIWHALCCTLDCRLSVAPGLVSWGGGTDRIYPLGRLPTPSSNLYHQMSTAAKFPNGPSARSNHTSSPFWFQRRLDKYAAAIAAADECLCTLAGAIAAAEELK